MKFRQDGLKRLIVFAFDEPAVQRLIEVVEQAEDVQFQVFEVLGVNGQVLVGLGEAFALAVFL